MNDNFRRLMAYISADRYSRMIESRPIKKGSLFYLASKYNTFEDYLRDAELKDYRNETP